MQKLNRTEKINLEIMENELIAALHMNARWIKI